MKLSKEYYISGDNVKLHKKTKHAECYIKDYGDWKSGMIFIGKQSKPVWYYKLRSVEELEKEFEERNERLESWEEIKRARKEEKKNAVLDVEVGDLFCSSWGYEQTNVDFYQCVKKNAKSFVVRAIGGRSTDSSDYPHGMADHVIAVKDSFLEDSPEILKHGFGMDYGYLSKTTENEKHYRSWYA